MLGDGADPTPSDIDTLAPLLEEVTRIHGARALERELGLTPLRSRTRDREEIPPRAADCEAHHGVDRFARWARRNLRPALRTTELRSWGDVYDVCSRFGVVIRPYANGLVFEDVKCGVHVKASFVARQLSKPRLCERLGRARACGRSTSRASSERARSAGRHGAAIATLPLASGHSSSERITFSGASSPRYPWPAATESNSVDNSRFDKPSKPEPSSESSRSNARRFRRPGIRGPGASSSQAAPPSATPARFDFYSDESGNATVPARRGSCEIQ